MKVGDTCDDCEVGVMKKDLQNPGYIYCPECNTAEVAHDQTSEADVRLNNLLSAEKFAEAIHYPRCWDTAAYPTLADAIWEALAWSGCSECQKHPET